MWLSSLRRLVDRLSQSPRVRRARRPRRDQSRPRLEQLEDRTLLTAGALDATFGTVGLVATGLLASASVLARALVIQSDTNVVVAGTANGDFAVARYTASGVLDTGFGN